jgi:hypothetical protein
MTAIQSARKRIRGNFDTGNSLSRNDDGRRLRPQRQLLANLLLNEALAVSPTYQFIGAASNDSAFKLKNDRYFVDFGAKPRDGSFEAVFVVDMESGEIAPAIIEAQAPALSIWEKSCISTELRNFSRARFRGIALRAAIDFHLDGISKSELTEYVGTTPCG